MSELLDEAAEERGVFRSEVTRRALRYYIGANPDGIDAFSGSSAPGVRGIDPSNTVVGGRGTGGQKQPGQQSRQAEIDPRTLPSASGTNTGVGLAGDGADETADGGGQETGEVEAVDGDNESDDVDGDQEADDVDGDQEADDDQPTNMESGVPYDPTEDL